MSKLHTPMGAAALLSLTSLVFASIPAHAAPEYTVTDLGTLGGNHSYATAINNSGVVVGYSALANDLTEHAFVYDTSMVDVSPSDIVHDNLFGINDLGQLAGTHMTNLISLDIAYSNVSGNPTELDISGAFGSNATAINNAGEITGVYNTGSVINGNTIEHAFFYRNNQVTDLGANGANYSIGVDINNHGDIVGYTRQDDGTHRSFLYSEGHYTDLGTFGGSSGLANAINDEGQIAGSITNLSGTNRHFAFAYQNGVITKLNAPTNAESDGMDINNHGQIVGSYKTPTGHLTAFVANNGVETDLNTLIDSQAHFLLSSAWKINDFGQIVGYGYPVGTTKIHAFRLTPTKPQIGIKGVIVTPQSAGYIHLAWTATPGATKYTITRNDTFNGPAITLGEVNSPTFDDKMVQVGKFYIYTITATNLTGAQLISDNIPATNAAVPSVPSVTATAISNTQIHLTWSAADGAKSYTIYRSTAPGTGRTIIGQTSSISFSDTHAQPATKYYYVVVAGNAFGYTKSAEASATTPAQ